MKLFTSRVLLTLMIGVVSLITSGCATITHDARNQAVLIQSEPPGAAITLDGRHVGTAPMYVLIPRERHPQLTLSRDGLQKSVVLQTKYRWGASFLSNFIFLYAAPVGWAVDFVTGSAWNPQDPQTVTFPDGRKRELPAPTAVAIAPPSAESLELSNAALPVLEEAINERKNVSGYHVLPYAESLPLFLARGFDFDGSGSNDERRMLYQSLNANGVWHSTFSRAGSSMNLKAQLEDTRTHKITDELNLMLDPNDERSKAYAQGFHLFALPNALTFSLSTQYFTYDRPGAGSISLQAADTRLWWQKGLQYLSAVSVTNLPVYRPERAGRWSLNFIPNLKLSRRDLVANGSEEIDGQNFTRWMGAVGYGPELGYQVGKNYFYLDVDWNAVWTTISWTDRAQDYSVTRTDLQASAEVGYLYLFTDLWSVRVFASTFPEDAQAWREALNKTSHGAIGSADEAVASNTAIGISLGFSYEPFLVRTFREKIRKAPSVSPAPNQASL